jgi:opacity protein-like surface antigen
MRKILAVAALAAAACTATAASAVTYVTTYSVSAYNGNNGLDISTAHDANSPLTFSLTGNTTYGWTDLFDIWSTESSVHNSDQTHEPISVLFTFTQPGSGGGSVNGVTYGVQGHEDDYGHVTWNGPLTVNFGGTSLKITLSDTDFGLASNSDHHNDESNNSDPWYAADVQAKFEQTVIPGGVPEPASWALMIGGFGMTGAALRRRRTAVAATA